MLSVLWVAIIKLSRWLKRLSVVRLSTGFLVGGIMKLNGLVSDS